MSTPFFIPPAHDVPLVRADDSYSLRDLCAIAAVPCRGSGAWTNRKVSFQHRTALKIVAEPGDWGSVLIECVVTDPILRSRLALQILAYSIHDLVAKESIRGAAWNTLSPPKGRPKKARALTSC